MNIENLGNVGTFKADVLNNSAFDDDNKIISFVALSKDNLHKRADLWSDEYYLSVDTSGVSFEATTLYKDHEVSFDNAIGKIIESKFENGVFKVKVKFDDDIKDSREAYAKYKAGLSDSVSVGFGEYKLKELEKIDGIPHFEIYEGKIMELSAVWQGADPNAKTAKFNKQKEIEKMSDEVVMQNAEQTKSNEVPNDTAELEALKAEQGNIIELGELMGMGELALSAIKNGKTYNDFKEEVKMNKTNDKYETVHFSKELSKDSKKDFSLANVLKSTVDNSIDLGYENNFQGSNGFSLPSEFIAKFASINTTSNTAIIENAYRGDLFIADLKKESGILNKLTWLENLSSNIDIPRDNSNIQAEFINEGASATEQNTSFDIISLRPNTLSAKVTITRKMLLMSSIDLENYVYTQMRTAIRRKLEAQLFYGKTVIKGIFETSGVPSIEAYLTTPTLAKTLEFSSKLYEEEIDTTNVNFVLNGTSANALRATSRESGTERKLLEGNDLQGYTILQSFAMKNGDIIFGDFSKIFAGSFGSLEVMPRLVAGGSIEIEAFFEVDMKLAKENAFVVSKTSAA
ncbi:phage major capsid protein [Campylobacter fetus]|uniref:phage major capsid protein n=1 Tax=Campylobacter fetus TaxID=196 RepID=UPI00138DFCF7|nr:phage major capsid protein [Campylobacter fetus]